MDETKVTQLFEDTAYVRMGGTDDELRCAEYLVEQCETFGAKAVIEPFPIEMAEIKEAVLTIDGKEYSCKGYLNAGTGDVEAPFYYMTNWDEYSLSQCKGKIIMIDGYMGYWKFQDVVKHGAVGFITYDGNYFTPDHDVYYRELRKYVRKDVRMPAVNINTKDAVEIVRNQPKMAKIHLVMDEWMGQSRNVVLDLPGQTDEYIVLTAHYDSVDCSQGAYDNMSGSIGIFGMAEYFASHAHRYGIRIVWCGSEERGLMGSKAYVAAHPEALDKIVLNVNLDMIGSVMGEFIAVCTSENELCNCISYLGKTAGFGIKVSQGVYSSDSTPFADAGIPAVSFARLAPNIVATVHNRYDTAEVVSAAQMVKDTGYICTFVEQMANAAVCPVSRTIPENMKEKLDEYMGRKRL